jgi:Protein of unknown function (DUF3301)
MQLSLLDVFIVIAIGGSGLYLMSAIRIRELALQAVVAASQRDDFQLLDQSVHIRRVSLSRDSGGRWKVWRQYRFDCSYDGEERQRGFVIMLGRNLQGVAVPEKGQVLH